MTDLPSAAIQAAAEVMFRQYESQYSASHLTWRDFSDDAKAVLAAAEPHIRANERERCVEEIFIYTQTMSPIVGAAYRDAARVLVNRSVPPGGRRDN